MISVLINIMVVYFLFIATFGGDKSRAYSIIIFLACLIFTINPLPSAVDAASHIINKTHYMYYDGATALIMCAFICRGSITWIHSLLLAFATLWHVMVILHLVTTSSFFWYMSSPFYSYYKELIIMTLILQMMVSYDGLIRALSNFQSLLLRTYYYFNRSYQGLFTHKDGGKRT